MRIIPAVRFGGRWCPKCEVLTERQEEQRAKQLPQLHRLALLPDGLKDSRAFHSDKLGAWRLSSLAKFREGSSCYGFGCLGWYRPMLPPPGNRIFVIEPHRSSATSEHSTPFARSAPVSALRSSHIK